MRVIKKFEFENIELRIVKRKEEYMSSGEAVEVTVVLAPNAGELPLSLTHKQSLKSIMSQTRIFLLNMRKEGHDFTKALTEIT